MHSRFQPSGHQLLYGDFIIGCDYFDAFVKALQDSFTHLRTIENNAPPVILSPVWLFALVSGTSQSSLDRQRLLAYQGQHSFFSFGQYFLLLETES
jgi:hypothetical protein